MGWFNGVGQDIVRRIVQATQVIPGARRRGAIEVPPAQRSGPPQSHAAPHEREMHEQHHVHPSDDEARRQEKG